MISATGQKVLPDIYFGNISHSILPTQASHHDIIYELSHCVFSELGLHLGEMYEPIAHSLQFCTRFYSVEHGSEMFLVVYIPEAYRTCIKMTSCWIFLCSYPT